MEGETIWGNGKNYNWEERLQKMDISYFGGASANRGTYHLVI